MERILGLDTGTNSLGWAMSINMMMVIMNY